MQDMKILYRRAMSTSAPGLPTGRPEEYPASDCISRADAGFLYDERNISSGLLGHQPTIDGSRLVGDLIPGVVLQNVPLRPLSQTLPGVRLVEYPGQLAE